MDANAVRRAFTQYFVDRGHTPVGSSGLIPHHPRAPLFTNAGMNQFIPYFLGEELPPYPRATSIQKCVRIRGKHDDIDLIGRTTRHLTFFEMLGNFSFGDYFKAGAIPLAWGLLTEVLGLDGDRLWVTVHTDDDEAAAIWSDTIGLPAGRLQRMGDDNFWEMGDTGPCGPSSEVYFDRGDRWGPPGGPAGGGGEERFVELWNLVFMQFDRQQDGSLNPLPKPNIDTGAGLERILMVLQGVHAVWDTDVLRPVIAEAERITGRHYGDDSEADVALRILGDHARSMTFLIGDGVFPSNEDRGYVLRRLIRRAVRHAYALGVERAVAADLVGACVAVMGEAYPDLAKQRDYIVDVVAREEARFRTTLRSGLTMLEAELAGGGRLVSGELAFRLHDTHGFPVELTREIASERGAGVDQAGFDAAMDRQRTMSKQAGTANKAGAAELLELYRSITEEHGPTRFVGYTSDTATGTVLVVVELDDSQAEVFLDTTPFYAEAGGQVGDTGFIETDTGRARVVDTTYALPGLVRHLAELEDGEIRAGQVAAASIDTERRTAIRRNHTGTHLLHWALRSVLGDHVKQQGSLVAPDRLRFDFTHYSPVTEEELERIEDLVNGEILRDEDVAVEIMPKREAEEAGAIAFFEEKYGDEVRVIRAGSDSMELCGGTHVARLGQIGPLEIQSEGSIGSNLRRIFATTGTATLTRLRQAEREISIAAGLLRSTPDELTGAIERKLAENRELEARVRSAQQASLAGQARTLVDGAAGGHVVARVDGLAQDQMRELAFLVRQSPTVDAVVLGGSPDGSKAALVAVVAKGAKPAAPELISEAARMVGGGGGGRNPEQASAGGRDAAHLDEALDHVRSLLAG
jgi:alanyl-tRNA synthetase